jgi:hypothetical protein
MRPFQIDVHGQMYLDVPTPKNSCQQEDRVANSPGIDPCDLLETRGGIWRYDARKTGQVFSGANRYATGIRNAEGTVYGDCRTLRDRAGLHRNAIPPARSSEAPCRNLRVR